MTFIASAGVCASSDALTREASESRDPSRVKAIATTPWQHLSSSNGELPTPKLTDNQTVNIVGDFDGNGRSDFVFTGRNGDNSVIWMRNTGRVQARYYGWDQYVIDPEPLNTEAGGTSFDVDGDGHLDLVIGSDSSNNKIWWWQNPYPRFDPKMPDPSRRNDFKTVHASRVRRSSELVQFEGETNFSGLQSFLSCVHLLCRAAIIALSIHCSSTYLKKRKGFRGDDQLYALIAMGPPAACQFARLARNRVEILM